MVVGRPRRVEDLVEPCNRDLALLGAVFRVEDRQRGVAAGDGRNRNAVCCRRPGAGRVDELNARVVRIGRVARELADVVPVAASATKRSIEKKLSFRQEREQPAIRADRRSDVELSAEAVALDDKPPDLAGRVVTSAPARTPA